MYLRGLLVKSSLFVLIITGLSIISFALLGILLNNTISLLFVATLISCSLAIVGFRFRQEQEILAVSLLIISCIFFTSAFLNSIWFIILNNR